MSLRFELNGKIIETDTNPLTRLLDFIRDGEKITSCKEGCGEGECGACSVLIEGVLSMSCLIPIGSVHNKRILTVDGLKDTPEFKILEDSFKEAGAVQCGFCTPGMILASYFLLKNNPKPTTAEIKEGLSGNLCRCTGYITIIEAVKMASERGEGIW